MFASAKFILGTGQEKIFVMTIGLETVRLSSMDGPVTGKNMAISVASAAAKRILL